MAFSTPAMRLFATTQLRICSTGEVAPRSFSLTCSQVRSGLRAEFGMNVWWKSHAPFGGAAFPGRSRPLCAYPLHAHYKGQGNPEDASNFECRP